MPLNKTDQTLLRANINAIISNIHNRYQTSFGNYAGLLTQQDVIDSYKSELTKFAEYHFTNKQLTAPLQSSQVDTFNALAARIIKLNIIQNLLDAVFANSAMETSFPALSRENIKSYLDAVLITDNIEFINNIKLLRSNLSTSELKELLTKIATNLNGIFVEILMSQPYELIKENFKRNNLDFTAYESWILVKKLGQKIGFSLPKNLSISVTVTNNNGDEICSLPIDPDTGNSRVNGFVWTKEVLTSFLTNKIEKDETVLRDDILKIIRCYQRTLLDGNKKFKRDIFQTDELFKCYMQQEIVIISGGWDTWNGGHAVGLAVYKDMLIYCNRGASIGFEKSHGTGTFIYRLPGYLPFSKLRILNSIFSSDELSLEAFKQLVPAPENPLYFLPAKAQKRGNCTFANTKNLVEGLLFIIDAERDANNNKFNLQKSREYAYCNYKRITTWMRDEELLNLAKRIVTDTEGASNTFKNLLGYITLQHHHNIKEQKRIYSAFNLIPKSQLAGVIDVILKSRTDKSMKTKFIDELIDKFVLNEYKHEEIETKSSNAPVASSSSSPGFFQNQNSDNNRDQITPGILIQLLDRLNDFTEKNKSGKGVVAAKALSATICKNCKKNHSLPEIHLIIKDTIKLYTSTKPNSRSTQYKFSQLLQEMRDLIDTAIIEPTTSLQTPHRKNRRA